MPTPTEDRVQRADHDRAAAARDRLIILTEAASSRLEQIQRRLLAAELAMGDAQALRVMLAARQTQVSAALRAVVTHALTADDSD